MAIGISLATIIGCKKDDVPAPAAPVATAPTANFTSSGGNCIVPCTITFTNTSSNAISYSWDFGDGNTSTLESPSNNYTSPGTWSVTLVATNSAGATTVISKTVATTAEVNQTNEQKLTGNGVWKLSAFTSSIAFNWPNGDLTNGQTDWFAAYVDPCEKIKRISFNASSGETDISGPNQTNLNGQPCNTITSGGNNPIWNEAFGQDGAIGAWFFGAGETQLEFNDAIWNIATLSGTELKLTITQTFNGTILTLTMTLTH